jgi:phospholipase C
MRFPLLVGLGLSTLILPFQAQITPIQHVVILIQENRTPDNLFGSNPSFEPGVDIAKSWNRNASPGLLTAPVRLLRSGILLTAATVGSQGTYHMALVVFHLSASRKKDQIHLWKRTYLPVQDGRGF